LSKIILSTPRLRLRTWHAADIEPFSQINADPQVMQYFPAPLQATETLAMLERIQQHFEEYGFGLYAAEYIPDNQLIGFIGFSHPRFEAAFTPCVEIGWRLDSKYWRMGLAYEGAKACLEYGFSQLGFTEVYSFTALSNQASENLMKKLGLQKIDEFEHPNLPADSSLKLHSLYKIEKNS
jgi:[ribosomal protein S5]-alanine N-acetyltransferase